MGLPAQHMAVHLNVSHALMRQLSHTLRGKITIEKILSISIKVLYHYTVGPDLLNAFSVYCPLLMNAICNKTVP